MVLKLRQKRKPDLQILWVKFLELNEYENMLIQMNCPTKFSQIGVSRETMEEMIEKAYTVRDRYTILTLMHDLGLSKMVKPMVLERFF